MSLRLVTRSVLMLVFAGAPLVHADTAVNVSASILESSCKVAANSLEQSIDLGKGRVADLKHAHEATSWKEFRVELTDCPDSVSQVVATISGAPDVDEPGYYLNTGTAQKVAIDVQDSLNEVQLSNGSTVMASVDHNHDAALILKGRIITPTGDASSGSVLSLVQLSFDFK